MTEDPGGSPTITESDLEGLNQRALLRSMEVARRLSTVLLALSALIALAWLWTSLRTQGVIGSDEGRFSPVFGGEELAAAERLDFFAVNLYSLGTAGLLGGIALALRTFCDVSIVRHGGNLTGWELGDQIDADPIDLER